MRILESNRSDVQQKQNAVRFQAATTQLDLATTFYLVASATKDQDRSNRAITNAQKAYAIAASSLDGYLKAEQRVEIEKKLVLLNVVRAGCPPTLRPTMTGVGPDSCGNPRPADGLSGCGSRRSSLKKKGKKFQRLGTTTWVGVRLLLARPRAKAIFRRPLQRHGLKIEVQEKLKWNRSQVRCR